MDWSPFDYFILAIYGSATSTGSYPRWCCGCWINPALVQSWSSASVSIKLGTWLTVRLVGFSVSVELMCFLPCVQALQTNVCMEDSNKSSELSSSLVACFRCSWVRVALRVRVPSAEKKRKVGQRLSERMKEGARVFMIACTSSFPLSYAVCLPNVS